MTTVRFQIDNIRWNVDSLIPQYGDYGKACEQKGLPHSLPFVLLQSVGWLLYNDIDCSVRGWLSARYGCEAISIEIEDFEILEISDKIT